jgi:hypothetical protein
MPFVESGLNAGCPVSRRFCETRDSARLNLWDLDSQVKSKVKGDGQECPSHTGMDCWLVGPVSGRGFQPCRESCSASFTASLKRCPDTTHLEAIGHRGRAGLPGPALRWDDDLRGAEAPLFHGAACWDRKR